MKKVSESDLVPADWMDGRTDATVEEWGQKEYDFGYKTGKGNGVAFAADWIMEQATEAFGEGRDADAARLRKLSKDVIEAFKKMEGRQ